MKTLQDIRLSMLDLVAVREGGTVAEALAVALRTAQHAESLGFTRYWLAEHHNMNGVAMNAPPAPTNPATSPIPVPVPTIPKAPGKGRLGLGFRSSTI